MREEIWSDWFTVEEMFQFISYAIEEKAAVLEVDYDPTLGFPTRMEVDMWAHGIDDERLDEISGFREEEG